MPNGTSVVEAARRGYRVLIQLYRMLMLSSNA